MLLHERYHADKAQGLRSVIGKAVLLTGRHEDNAFPGYRHFLLLADGYSPTGQDEDFVFPSSYQASANGISLVSTGDVLTWGNEIDKLSSNISLGRDWAGVHYRSDGVEGIILGEQVARGVLQDVAKTYSEFNEGEIVFTYKTYLGEDVEIRK